MPAGADRTAVGPMVIVAVEQFERSPPVHDPCGTAFEAVVIHGAGFGTRASRVPASPESRRGSWISRRTRPEIGGSAPVFGRVPDGVTLVPIDFGTQDLHEELRKRKTGPSTEDRR